jgi:GNAT superfamily N-acetyltransferase
MTAQVRLATELDQIERCAPVMRELRASVTESEIIERIQEQRYEGYRLAFVEITDAVVAVAGYRVLEHLVYGRFLYVDDLATRAESKRNGFAGLLFDWMLAEARKERCAAAALDSGVQRFEAHRFFLRHGMDITAHHFTMWL